MPDNEAPTRGLVSDRSESTPPSDGLGNGRKYDAFISYSHSADRNLAKSLEETLSTFGRRWYQVRGIRTYRDETNLAAEPDLWPAIEKAIYSSSCLILCASPASAHSVWVPREVETFIKQRGLQDVCVVQTSGVLPWTDHLAAEDALEHEDSALSRPVWQLFEDAGFEPLVVDLRQFRTMSERERLKDPDYLSLVASVAAKVLGEDKSSIWGRYYRAQRLRAAFLGSVSVVLFGLVLALGFAFRNEVRLRAVSVQETAEAVKQRGIAEQQTRVANEQKRIAFAQLATALSTEPQGELHALAAAIQAAGSEKEVAQKTMGTIDASIEQGLTQAVFTALPRIPLVGQNNSVRFSRDAKLVVATSQDGILSVLDARSGKQLRKVDPLGGYFQYGAFDAHAHNIVAISCDASFGSSGKLWILSMEDPLRKPERFSIQGCSGQADFFSGAVGRVVYWNSSGIGVLDAQGNLQMLLEGDFINAGHASISVSSGTIAGLTDSGSLYIWKGLNSRKMEVPAHASKIALSEDGSRIAIGYHDGTLRLLSTFGEGAVLISAHDGPILSLAWSPNGDYIASGGQDETVKVWDQTGKSISVSPEHRDWVLSLAFERRKDLRNILWAADRNGQVNATDLGDNTLFNLSVSRYNVNDVQAAGDGSVAFSGPDPVAWIWRPFAIVNPVHIGQKLYPIVSAGFSDDGEKMVTSSYGPATLWNIKANFVSSTCEAHTDTVAVANDGKRIVTADALQKEKVAYLCYPGTDRPPIPLDGHEDVIRRVSFSRDGSTIISASQDGSARTWDGKSGKFISKLSHGSPLRDASLSRDGEVAATLGTDGTVRVWRKSVPDCQFPERHDHATNLEISPKGDIIAIAESSGFVSLVKSPCHDQSIITIGGRSERVYSLSFNADGDVLAIVGRERTSIWSTRGDELASLPEPEVTAISVRVDQADNVTVLDNRGFLWTYPLSPSKLLRLACSEYIARGGHLQEMANCSLPTDR
jgi:WD40 repeat protein